MVGNWIHVPNTDPSSNYRHPKIRVVDIAVVIYIFYRIESK